MLTTALLLATTIWLIGGWYLLGRRTPDYRPDRDTISELGANGARHEYSARLGLFLPTGILGALSALAFLPNQAFSAAGLAASFAIGYLSAAAFPVDAGAPLKGTRANTWHNLGGAIMYLGGSLSLLAAYPQSIGFPVAGLMGLAGTTGLLIPAASGIRGWIQRFTEILFLAALLAHSLL